MILPMNVIYPKKLLRSGIILHKKTKEEIYRYIIGDVCMCVRTCKEKKGKDQDYPCIFFTFLRKKKMALDQNVCFRYVNLLASCMQNFESF